MEVSFESTDPQLAARMVNAHLETYIEQNYRRSYEATTQASRWLAGQLDELKIKVEKSENARIEYERQNQIWTVDDKQNMTTQRLGDLNKELTDAQSDRIKKQALYEFAKSGELEAVPQLRDNAVLQDLQRRRSDLSVQYTEAVNQYGPNFPKVQRIQAQIKDVDEQITRQSKSIIVELENDYRAALQLEELRTKALDQQKADTNVMSEKMVQYNILRREAEANKALYEGLLTKLKEAGISAGLRSSNVRIIDPAMIPSHARTPRQSAQHCLGFPCGPCRRNRFGAAPRVSRQHREDPR